MVPGGMCQSLDKVTSGLRTVLLVQTSPKVEEEERFQEVMGASAGSKDPGARPGTRLGRRAA